MAKHEDVDYQFNRPDNTNPVSKMRHRTQVSASSFYPLGGRPQSATQGKRNGFNARNPHFFDDSDWT